MSVCWFFCFVVAFLLVAVNSRVDLDSAVRLAHCRATCIYKMNLTKLSDQGCRGSRDCSQCWEICSVLQTSPTFCERTACVGSCQESCRWISTGPTHTNILTQPLEDLTFTSTSVSWPPLTLHAPNPVYVVMVDHQQFLQTLDLAASLPLAVDPLAVQVLVVDWRGLTEVFTPRPQSPLELARTLVRQLGLEETMGLSDNFPGRNGTLIPNVVVFKNSDTPWRLIEVSRTYLEDLVRVHLTWAPQQLPQRMYLVTWQVEDGIIRGNLLTNNSSVTLSLGTHTLFRIQVALFTLNSPSKKSEVLVVDTHPPPEHPHLLLSSNLIHSTLGLKRGILMELLVAASSAVVVLAVLALAWRCQHWYSQSHTKVVHVDLDTPKSGYIYRNLSSKIGLSPEPFYKTEHFSSTEHLIEHKTKYNELKKT